MCGIFGVIGETISSEELAVCINSLKHRGPDGEGVYSDKNIYLGFRRLSILDLSSNGDQPMSNEKKNIWLVYNGEIYNFKELKQELRLNHHFISKTDSEVIVHGYEEWGIEGLLKRIEGMFAFCLYDKKRQVCFLVRDRIGEKPLYYYEKENVFAFSSEVKAFFNLSKFEFSLDEEKLNIFFGFPYLPDNKGTITKNVFKIPPGSYLKIDLGNKNKRKEFFYWKFDDIKTKEINLSSGKDLLYELIKDSVKKKLTADVPIGILLSGGLDSSLITAVASKMSSERIKTINISFPGSVVDESDYARKVAGFCGTEHISLRLKSLDLYGQLKDNVWIFDDPSTLDGGILSTFLMCEEVKKTGVKVLLTGEGADEVFGGYSWFFLSKLFFIPEVIKSRLYHYAIMRVFSYSKFFNYADILKRKMDEISTDYFKKMQRFEVLYSLPNNYCMKLDRSSSAASVETRHPYLDYRIIELSKSLNANSFLRFDQKKRKYFGKYILRLVAENLLPREIAFRRKRGGMLPVAEILKEGLKKDDGLILENEYLVNFFGKKELERLLKRKSTFLPFVWEKEWLLWKFLVFSLWLSKYKECGKNRG